jgi:hypothetical protein
VGRAGKPVLQECFVAAAHVVRSLLRGLYLERGLDRGRPIGRSHVYDLWPVHVDGEIVVVFHIVAGLAFVPNAIHPFIMSCLSLGSGASIFVGIDRLLDERVVGLSNVLAGRPMAAFTTDVDQVFGFYKVLKTRLLAESDRVADDAFAVELP